MPVVDDARANAHLARPVTMEEVYLCTFPFSPDVAPVADDVYRFQAIALATGEVKMIHGTNEHMTLANLESLIAFYARLLATAAG